MNKAQTVFLFPRGIKMRLGDALAMNYAASFRTIHKSPTLETRVLSIFADHTTFITQTIHILDRSKGRLSRDRPIIVSDQSPVLYVWTGQGRQAFEVYLSSEEYGRATCRSPEDVNTTLSVEPTPFVTPEELEGIKGSEVLNPEMIRCLLAFKQGLQSPRQISVTVARCQDMVAAYGGHSINHYEQWFVRSGVVVQPYTRANIVRVHVDHGRLEGLLTEAGYSFNDQGYRVSSGSNTQIVVENEVTTTESAQKAVKTTECTGDLQDKNQEFQSNIQMLADQSFVHCEELKDPLRSLLPTNLDRDQQIDWLADFIDQLVKKR